MTGISKLLTPGDGEIENVTLSEDRKTIYYTTNISGYQSPAYLGS